MNSSTYVSLKRLIKSRSSWEFACEQRPSTLRLHSLVDSLNPNRNRNLQVHIYELTHQDDKFDLRYRLKDKIYLPTATKTPPSVTPIEAVEHIGEGIEESKGAGSAGWEGRGGGGGRAAVSTGGCGNGESNFLLVTWNNVVLCEDNVLQLYDFAGIKVIVMLKG